jgi:beta-lactamase regulating signal transducer with metallopeptidase domain
MNTLAELFIENAIKSALLACFVALLAVLPRVRNLANLQHSLWGLVLVAMIVPSFIQIPLISLPATEYAASPLNEEPARSESVPTTTHVITDDPHNVAANLMSCDGIEIGWLFRLGISVWLGGTIYLVVITLRRVHLLRRTIRLANFDDASLSSLTKNVARALGIRRQVRVAIVRANSSPFIWVEQKAIYIVISESLRVSLSERQLQSVMMHELSHYLRRDHWSNTFGFLVLALCWWNPVSWIAVRKMRALQEYCCDAMAIAKSRLSRREYAECLYQITNFIESRNSCLPASACELFGHTSVEERFQMISNTSVAFKNTKAGFFMVFFFSALLPCTLAFSQADTKEVQKDKEQKAKDTAESKQWHETLEKFNRLVTDGDWQKAEQLANETASKFGHDDALVQNMLLTSINGMRKSQGLAPIIIQKLLADPKADEIPIVVLYSLKDFLPANAAEKEKFVDILTQCILASIANDGSDKPAVKVHYDTVNHGLIVLACKPQQKLTAEILKRIGQKAKP